MSAELCSLFMGVCHSISAKRFCVGLTTCACRRAKPRMDSLVRQHNFLIFIYSRHSTELSLMGTRFALCAIPHFVQIFLPIDSPVLVCILLLSLPVLWRVGSRLMISVWRAEPI